MEDLNMTTKTNKLSSLIYKFGAYYVMSSALCIHYDLAGFSLENEGFLTKCYNLSNFSEHISCSKIDFLK